MKTAPVLLILAAVSPVLAQGQDREIVKVNGTPIRQSEVVERLWRRYGPQTLEEMVDELLLRQAVAADKIKVAPADVETRLDLVQRQNPNFPAMLEKQGRTIADVKTELEDQLKFERMIASRKKLSASEAEVKKAFNEHKKDLGQPEAVHLRHILVGTKPEAEDLAGRVKSGADFTALAKEKSLAPTGKLNGGDYGFVARGILPPEIEKIAFAMKEGELKVFPTEKGHHVLQVLARRASMPAEYEKVKDELKVAVLQEKIRAALPGVVRELREKAQIEPHRQ